MALALTSVNHGYTEFGRTPVSGACNVDVVCSAADGFPQIDAWRDEIRSVGVMSINGTTFCTGALVNNTAQDFKPYFLTADHCNVDAGNAASLVVYWNFENSTCRAPGSTASGSPGDGTLTQFNSGTTFLAANTPSDMTLLELDDPIDSAFNVYWAGWDRSGNDATTAVAIHHPSTDEKRISFENDPTSTTSYGLTTVPGNGTHIRITDWDLGTTEPGSSGSPLFDQNGRVIGQLHGGFAACGNDSSDWYGRLNVSWTGGGTNATRLSNWLDPNASGVTTLDGTDATTAQLVCNGTAINFETGIPAAFTTAATGNVYWTTTADSSGCGQANQTPGADGAAACADSDKTNGSAVPYDAEMWTNSFDLSGHAAATLNFDTAYRDVVGGERDKFEVDVSTDAGSTWSNALSWDESHYTPGENVALDLSPYVGQADVRVRFRYYSNDSFNWDWWVQVDDIALNCSTCATPTAVSDLAASINGNFIDLNWTDTGADEYLIYRLPNNFYFTPPGAGTFIGSTTGTSFSDNMPPPDVIGDPNNNYGYVIIAQNNCNAAAAENGGLGTTSGPSNRVGEFDFAIATDAPPLPTTFADDFESGLGNWTLDGLWNAENQGDTCGALHAPFPSPTNAAYFGQDGLCDYDTGSQAIGSLTMNDEIALPPASTHALVFSYFLQTENAAGFDKATVEITTDNGANWTQLLLLIDSNWTTGIGRSLHLCRQQYPYPFQI